MKPSFLAWLLRQALRDDPVGDLARDAAIDPRFPRSVSHIKDYMRAHGSDGANRSLARAISEWTSEAAK